jgi:hypothetical protein
LSDTELLRQHDGNHINNNNKQQQQEEEEEQRQKDCFLHEFQQSLLVHHPTINLHKTWSENDIELNE